MRKTILAVAVTTAAVTIPTVVHADETIIDMEGITYQYAEGVSPTVGDNDPIAVTFNYGLKHIHCNPGTPPLCYSDSTLGFWVSINLGYRNHQFKGRTGILSGSRLWSEWYAKKHLILCKQSDGDNCGYLESIGTGKLWSSWEWYETFMFPNPGFFRLRYSACLDGACGYSVRRTLPIYCKPRAEQCYFDV